MTQLKIGLGIAVVALLAAASAVAQTAGQTGAVTTTTGSASTTSTTTTTGTTSTTTVPGSFESLSPGNQKIAQALFEAQTTPTSTGGTTATTATGPTPLTRDQIAALKGTTGWGHVFMQMRAQGLVQAKNLGQVISGYEHQTHVHQGAAAGDRVVVTNGSGRSSTLAATGNGSHQGDGLGGKHGDSSTDADGGDMVVTTAGGTSSSGTGVAGGSASAHADGVSHGGGHSK